jgi:hypothetical protein
MNTTNTSIAGNGNAGLRGEIRIIPGWAFAVAAVVFILVPVLFFTFVWSDDSGAPRAFGFLVSFLPGTVIAFLTLMIGYVNADAGRRGMSRALWTLLVIIIPNAIGFILYLLLRSPIKIACTQCGSMADPRVNFCPRCGFNFQPTCPHCRATVRPGDVFCTTCGKQLDEVA